jgi:hypothetical protein
MTDDTQTAASDGATDTSASPAVETQPVPNAGTQAPDASASPGDTSTPQATPANPEPTTQPRDERADLLSIVQDVVKAKSADPKNPGGEGSADDKPPGEGETPLQTDTAPAAQPEADPTEDELKALPPRTAHRIKALLRQRGEARAEVENLKPAAAKWAQLDGYLTQHDLAPEDVNLLLGVGAALRRGDFKAFRDGVMPYLELANQHLGLTLPADLQAKVDQGEMTTEAATELSVARLNNQRLTGQVKATTEATQAQIERDRNLQTARIVNDAVTSWENDVKSRDPDYPKKAAAVMRVSQALIAQHGQPMTAEAAVKLAQMALDETNAMFANAIPPRPPSRPVPAGANGVNHARPEPRTLMEAALMGLERARARPH